MPTPLERAIQPNQYDTGNVLWAKEGRAESTHTQFFWEYLEPYSKSWNGKTILDIGAGTGWLVARALKCGAAKAVGIEPSEKNVVQGKQDHPNVELVQTTFERFDGKNKQFDEIIAVMSFPHIADPGFAFSKIRSLLAASGEAIIIVPDYDYFQTPRHGYSIEKQLIDEESYAITITRPSGTLADIVRKTSAYKRAAKLAGLELVEEKEMKPTENQIANSPKYASVKDKTITRLLVFKINLGVMFDASDVER